MTDANQTITVSASKLDKLGIYKFRAEWYMSAPGPVIVINVIGVDLVGAGSYLVTKLAIHAQASYGVVVTPSSEVGDGSVFDWKAEPDSLIVGAIGGNFIEQTIRAGSDEGSFVLTAKFTQDSVAPPIEDAETIEIVIPTGESTSGSYSTGEATFSGKYGKFSMEIAPEDAYYRGTRIQEYISNLAADDSMIFGSHDPSLARFWYTLTADEDDEHAGWGSVWTNSWDGAYSYDYMGLSDDYLEDRAVAGILEEGSVTALQNMHIAWSGAVEATRVSYKEHSVKIEVDAFNAFSATRDGCTVYDEPLP